MKNYKRSTFALSILIALLCCTYTRGKNMHYAEQREKELDEQKERENEIHGK